MGRIHPTPARRPLWPLWLSLAACAGQPDPSAQQAAPEGGRTKRDSGPELDAASNEGAVSQADAGSETAVPTGDAASDAGGDADVHWGVGETRPLCVLAGVGDVRAPGQEALAFYGTDLGFTYGHDARIEFLFGDSIASLNGDTIDPSVPNDDAFASVSLDDYGDGDAVERACAGGGLSLRFGTHADGSIAALDPGRALDGFKTPVAGFSTGEHEIGIFYTGKPRGCKTDADCGELSCDTGLGFVGSEYYTETGPTLPCVDGSGLLCLSNTMADNNGLPVLDSGFCIDPDASVASGSNAGRLAATAIGLLVGVRDSERYRYVSTHAWLTTRFLNPSVTTVRSFEEGAVVENHDYRRPTSSTRDAAKVLLFGRPQFVGVGSEGRSAQLYLAYADMPRPDGQGQFDFRLRFFTHVDPRGIPQFSDLEREAAPLDLSGGVGDTREVVDVVNQTSVRFVEALGRWVMLYGGGTSRLPVPVVGPQCGVLEVFAREACDAVREGDGAVYVRTASHPWGPWSAPQKVLVGGDPQVGDAQYGPGGQLRHAKCSDPHCAPHDAFPTYNADEYGFFYGANLIEQWTQTRAEGSVDLYWNVSSWDPYRVVLMKTSLLPSPF